MADTILIGEDEPVQRQMLTRLLTKKLGYHVLAAENGREVVRKVQSGNIDAISAVVLDIDMPEMNGMEALAELRKYRPDLPVLILTGKDDTAVAVAAIKAGASDFIVKPTDPAQLDVALKNAIRVSTLSREIARLKRDREGALRFQDIIGYDNDLAPAITYARKAAVSEVPVLMTGEISTGKELLARAVHGEGRRTGAPFVTVHCNATPEPSLEALLFGYEKNAPGKFREAERGTIFLDDIHALSQESQTKLLRVLQQREIEFSGKVVKVNVRVISATDHDLRAEVREGRFREDLYFRLNVLTIAMPPLRERKHDIVPLAEYFLHRAASMDGLHVRALASDARHYLAEYRWPGNLRELEGLMHRALVLGEGETITRALLKTVHDTETKSDIASDAHIALLQANGLPRSMAEIEAEAMRKTLERCGSISRAAEALGIAKSTFYRKMSDVKE